MANEPQWSMRACELDVPEDVPPDVPQWVLWVRRAGEIIHDRDCEMVFDPTAGRLTITEKGQPTQRSWPATVQYIRWMAPKETPPPGSALQEWQECKLNVDLKDYRGGPDVELVTTWANKSTSIQDALGSGALPQEPYKSHVIVLDPQTKLLTITARLDRAGTLPTTTPLNWIVPARHVQGHVPKSRS